MATRTVKSGLMVATRSNAPRSRDSHFPASGTLPSACENFVHGAIFPRVYLITGQDDRVRAFDELIQRLPRGRSNARQSSGAADLVGTVECDAARFHLRRSRNALQRVARAVFEVLNEVQAQSRVWSRVQRLGWLARSPLDVAAAIGHQLEMMLVLAKELFGCIPQESLPQVHRNEA